MREFLARIWTAKASTFAGIVAAGLAVVATSWAEAPWWARVLIPALLAMLGAFSKGEEDARLP